MRFFSVLALFSQCAIGDDTVQLLVSIPQAVSLAYKTNEESFNELYILSDCLNDCGSNCSNLNQIEMILFQKIVNLILAHQNIIKPTCILQYNKHMKEVYRADQYLENSSILGKTLKWSKKLAFFPINCTLLDAYKTYCTYLPETAPYYNDAPFRLFGQLRDHVLKKIVTGRKTNPTRACRVCCSKGKHSETRYICKSCCLPLHVGDCYTVYHRKKKY